MASDPARDRLAALLNERSIQHGSFTLSSGKTSAYYIDARRTTMSAEGLQVLGHLGLGTIREQGWEPGAVGGLTLGADPFAYAIAHASQSTDQPLNAFTVRKKPKEHATARRIEGCFEAGDRVVVVEDVVTTGASALQAAQAVQGEGGEVLGVLAIVDREEGGAEAIRQAGFDLVTLLTLNDLGIAPPGA